MKTKIKNREDWLSEGIKLLRPVFKKEGHPVPERVRAAVGFPSVRAMSAKRKRIGECWNPSCSADNTHEIIISPVLSDVMDVFETLTHELAHAAVGTEHGHKGPFVKLVRALGLEGKPTSTVAGPEFKKLAEPILKKLGPLPHGALTGASSQKKQTTRMIKCVCAECGYVARTTQKWIDLAGAPVCPRDKVRMEVA
jgi:hypothetical protein